MPNNNSHSRLQFELNNAWNILKSNPSYRSLCHDLFDEFKAANKAEKNYFLKVYNSAVSRLENIFNTKFNYFHIKSSDLSYELAMHIYYIANQSELLEDNPKVTLKEAHEKIKNTLGTTTEQVQKQFSQKEKQLFSDLTFDNNQNLRGNDKLFEYKQECGYLRLLHKKTSFYMQEYDFAVFNHSHSYFYKSDSSKGITFNNIYDTLNNYANLYDDYSDISFDAEISAFIKQRLYYGISYSSLLLNYATTNINNKIPAITKELCYPLYLYARIFDTHYPSLSEYLIKQYELNNVSYFDDCRSTEDKIDIFIRGEKYQAYLIPLIYYIVLVTMYELYGKNTELMARHLKDLISIRIQSSVFTYRKRLLHYHNQITLATNAAKKDNEIPSSWNIPSSVVKKHGMFYSANKSRTPEYDLSKFISRMYFNGSHPKTHLISIPSFYENMNELYGDLNIWAHNMKYSCDNLFSLSKGL